MSEPIDPEAFRDFEYAGWQKFARGYHDNFAKLTTQIIGPLLDAVNVTEGVRVLDVATGAGYAAAGNETTRLPEGLTIQECPEVDSSTN